MCCTFPKINNVDANVSKSAGTVEVRLFPRKLPLEIYNCMWKFHCVMLSIYKGVILEKTRESRR